MEGRGSAVAAACLAALVLGWPAVSAPACQGAGIVAAANTGADAARDVELLVGGGSIIGARVREVGPADIEKHKLREGRGVVIEDVREKSPAEQAGLRAGDVVLTFDGETVRSVRQFTRLVRETPAGRKVRATISRDGRTQEIEITPEAPEDLAARIRRTLRPDYWTPGPWPFWRPELELPDAGALRFELEGIWGRGRLGVTVTDLSPELAEYLGARKGVLVNAVEPGSPAARAGLKAGDVIASIDGQPVESAAELRRRLRDREGEDVVVGIVRDKTTQSITVRIERPGRTVTSRRWTM
jgi:serine protease Do